MPGAVPAPEQVEQTTAVSTVRSRVVPNAVSASSRSSRISASAPCRTRLRGPRAVDAPKKASMMSPRPPKPAPNGLPAGAAAGRQRVAAEVDDLPLLRVGEHLVRRAWPP